MKMPHMIARCKICNKRRRLHCFRRLGKLVWICLNCSKGLNLTTRDSSVAECLAHNQTVVGSIPIPATK